MYSAREIDKMGKGKKDKLDIPLFISMVNKDVLEQHVSVSGIVIRVRPSSKKKIYVIDDGLGLLSCVCYDMSLPSYLLGDYVTIRGKLRLSNYQDEVPGENDFELVARQSYAHRDREDEIDWIGYVLHYHKLEGQDFIHLKGA